MLQQTKFLTKSICSLIPYLSLTLGITFVSTSPIFAQSIPKAQCLSRYGQTVCGYNCVAQYGDIRCADWPGGVCKASYGDIVCGPPAPPNWVLLYQNNCHSRNSNSGVYGAWYVQNGNNLTGILRMKGNFGTMTLVGSNFVVEQRMTLKPNPRGGYILDGDVLTTNSSQYRADNFYIQQFSRGPISAKNCNNRRTDCSDVTLTYIGK